MKVVNMLQHQFSKRIQRDAKPPIRALFSFLRKCTEYSTNKPVHPCKIRVSKLTHRSDILIHTQDKGDSCATESVLTLMHNETF